MENKMVIIDGRKIASELIEDLKLDIANLKNRGISPDLTVVIIGENPSSMAYVRMIKKQCEIVGVSLSLKNLPMETTEDELLNVIDRLNNDDNVHGILIEMPLPKHINLVNVLNAINPDKDVDAFNPISIGRVLTNQEGFVQCTPASVMAIIEYQGIDLSGKNVVVIGRSNIVGKPLAMLMINKNATVTICHSKTENLSLHTKNADLVVVAVGIPNFLKKDMLKDGAIVIDVGINQVDGKLVGDVDYKDVLPVVSQITPVPGGVGSVTIVMLVRNVILAAKRWNR